MLLVRRLGGQTSRAALLDTVIVSAALLTVEWVFLFDPYLHEHASARVRIVDIAYPVMNTALLVALSQLLGGPSRRSSAYRLLVTGVGLSVVGALVYGTSSTYKPGGWLDLIYLGTYVIWGAAAVDPSVGAITFRDRRTIPRLTPLRLLLLGGALLAGPAVLIVERLKHDHIHVYVVAIGTAVIGVLAVIRFAGLVRGVEAAQADERAARRDAEFAQEMLKAQNIRLRELDRLKDEFVSSVSHEFRTPLTSIIGYVELLLEEETEREGREFLGVIDRNAQRLLDLVSDMLFAARLQAGELALQALPVDLGALVEESVLAARPRADAARVDLHVRSDASLPDVAGEQGRLAQVLDNLISNAIKFSPEGGEVEVLLTRRDDAVVLEVSDNGIGISEEERDRLFERFFRSQTALERQISGTGLGLYISKAIVDAHGGRIAVRSVVGEGTTFVVELPVAVQ